MVVVVVVVVCEIKHIWAGERSRRSFIAGPGEERIIAPVQSEALCEIEQ
jgi:hypothetical protein